MRILATIFLLQLAMAGGPSAQTTATKLATRVTTRLDFGYGEMDETILLQGDRQREEIRRGPWWQRWMAAQTTIITRCDLGRAFYLNNVAREYSSSEFPPKPFTAEELKARGMEAPQPFYGPRKATFRIETTTVDTGERKQMFGRQARHVITTSREIPFEGSQRAWQELVRDGWYIDFDLQLPCEPWHAAAGSFAYLTGGSRGHEAVETPEIVNHGKPEMGFALDERTVSKVVTVLPDGTKRESRNTSRRWVTELREVPADAGVFEVPARYKHVEKTMPKLSKAGAG